MLTHLEASEDPYIIRQNFIFLFLEINGIVMWIFQPIFAGRWPWGGNRARFG
jgi:hypothetical protein